MSFSCQDTDCISSHCSRHDLKAEGEVEALNYAMALKFLLEHKMLHMVKPKVSCMGKFTDIRSPQVKTVNNWEPQYSVQ